MTREEEIKFRDECAMGAIQSLLRQDISGGYDRKGMCAEAYEIADAMLEEKKKRDHKSTNSGN